MAHSSFLKRMLKLRKAETTKDPFKTGESFTTLHNKAARDAEHEQLMREQGFPSEQDPNAMRYQRYAEVDSDPDSPDGVTHNQPPWIVNEASEMIYNIPDDDAPSFKHSDKAKSRAGENTMDVTKSGILQRQVKLMKQGGSDGTRIKNTRSYTPSHEGGEIGTTAGGMNVGGRTGQSIGSQSVANYGGTATKPTTTPKTSTGGGATGGPEINTGQEKPWQAPTPTAKPADITASDYVTPSNLRDTGKIDTRDVPTPLKTTNLYDNVIGANVSDTVGPTPSSSSAGNADPTSTFIHPSGIREVPLDPARDPALLRGLTSDPAPAIGDTTPRASTANVPVIGIGSPADIEEGKVQGREWSPLTGYGADEGFGDEITTAGSGGGQAPFTTLRGARTWAEGQRGETSQEEQAMQDVAFDTRDKKFGGGGRFEDVAAAREAASAQLAADREAAARGRPVTRGDETRFRREEDESGNLVLTPELRSRQQEEAGMFQDLPIDPAVLSQRQQERAKKREDEKWGDYGEGLDEGLYVDSGTGVRRSGRARNIEEMEKSLTKRLIKLQKSQGRMLEKQGLGEIGPTNTGGGRSRPNMAGRRSGASPGTGGMSGRQHKLRQPTPSPTSPKLPNEGFSSGRGLPLRRTARKTGQTGMGNQGMGEIQSMQKQSPSEGGPERWNYERQPGNTNEFAGAQSRYRQPYLGEYASLQGKPGGNLRIDPDASPEARQALKTMSAQAERQRVGKGEFADAGPMDYETQMGKPHPEGTRMSVINYDYDDSGNRTGTYDDTQTFYPGKVSMNPDTGVYTNDPSPSSSTQTSSNQGYNPADRSTMRQNKRGTPSAPMQAMLKRLIKLQKAHRKARPEEGRRTGKDAYSRQPRPEDPAGEKRQLRWGMEPDPITGELVGTMRQKHDAETKSGIAGLTPLSEIQTDAEKKAQAQQARMSQWAAEAAAEEIPKGRTKGKKSN